MWTLGIKGWERHMPAWRNGKVCCERHLQQKKFEMPVHGFMLEIRYTPRLEPVCYGSALKLCPKNPLEDRAARDAFLVRALQSGLS